MNYLTPEQAETNLRVGKVIEQWLSRVESDGLVILRWVQLRLDVEAGILVTLFEAYEDENAERDLYGLYAVESDSDGAAQEVFAAGKSRAFGDVRQAFDHVVSLGGSDARYMNRGFLEDAYREDPGRAR